MANISLSLNPEADLAVPAAIPIGMVGADYVANRLPETNVLGVRLFGNSVVDNAITRLVIGAGAIMVPILLNRLGLVPESNALDVNGMIEGVFWGIALGALASGFMSIYTYFTGPYTFDESIGVWPDGVPADTNSASSPATNGEPGKTMLSGVTA